PMRGAADDVDSGAAQAVELAREVRAGTLAAHALQRDEVVVPADLVAELLQRLERVDEVGATPVRRRVQNEVGRAQAARALELRELERAVEADVDVVPQGEDRAHVGGRRGELAQR